MYLPLEKLRPSDRFEIELSQRTSEFDSGFGLLLSEMAGMAKTSKVTITGKIESVDDYIRWMCVIKSAGGWD